MNDATLQLGDLDSAPDLSGRVVLIVGATGAIGQALAIAIGQAGAEVIITGRHMLKLEKTADAMEAAGCSEPVLYPVDLAGAQPGDYEQMAAAIEEQCGRLDAVVHLVADFPGLTPLDQVGFEAWQKTFAVNVHAPFLINQAVAGLLAASAGRILMTLDDLDRVGRAYWGAYGVAKHALAGLVSITAQELESQQVFVAGVVPPPTRSRLRANAYLHEESQPADPATVAQGYLQLLQSGTIASGSLVRLVS